MKTRSLKKKKMVNKNKSKVITIGKYCVHDKKWHILTSIDEMKCTTCKEELAKNESLTFNLNKK